MRCARARTATGLALLQILVLACAGPQEQADVVSSVPPDGWRIVFEGNPNLPERNLRRAAEDDLIVLQKEGKEYMADDAAYTMEERYREAGFPSARVDYAFEQGPPPRVIFRIQEGQRTVLGDVALPGRGEVPRKTLMRFLEGPTSTWLGGYTLYSQSRVEDAARLIQQWYRSEGYLRAEVDAPEVTFRDGNTRADVCISIRPGLIYTILEIRLEGIGEPYPEALLEQLDPSIGKPFTRPWVTRTGRRIVSYFRSQGHVTPKVSGETVPDHETGRSTVIFTIQPGPVRRVGRLDIVGQERTARSFLQTLLHLESGHRFNGNEVKQTTDALYTTGLFTKVSVEEIPIGEDLVDLTFRITERDAKDVSFMGGYGSYELIRGTVTYTDRNLFGKGLNWSTGLKLSFRGERVKSSLSDTRFLNLPLTGTVEAFTERREFSSYTEKRYGGVASLSKDWFDRLNTRVGYSFERSWADELDPVAQALGLDEQVGLGMVFTRWALDYRNSRVMPSRGSFNEARFEVASKALGGDLDYNRLTGRSTWQFPLDEETRWVIGLRAEAGLIIRKSGTDLIPLQYRFYNGGAESVRSFREDELGPQAGGDATGGEYYSTGSIELRTPLYKRLRAAFFGDAGNVILRRSDVGFHDYRYALGLGLRYALPIGPVRLDWGWNPNRRSEEELWALHLSVGFPF